MTPVFHSRGAAQRAAHPLFGRFMQLLDATDRVSYLLIVVAMGVMVVLVSTQVFFRYALASSIDWAEECSRLFFVWSMFLAIPQGIRAGTHVGIDIVVRRFPHRLQETLFRVLSGVALALLVLVFVQALRATYATWDEMMPTLEITSGVFYIPVVLAAAHGALHLIPMALFGTALVEPHELQEESPA